MDRIELGIPRSREISRSSRNWPGILWFYYSPVARIGACPVVLTSDTLNYSIDRWIEIECCRAEAAARRRNVFENTSLRRLTNRPQDELEESEREYRSQFGRVGSQTHKVRRIDRDRRKAQTCRPTRRRPRERQKSGLEDRKAKQEPEPVSRDLKNEGKKQFPREPTDLIEAAAATVGRRRKDKRKLLRHIKALEIAFCSQKP